MATIKKAQVGTKAPINKTTPGTKKQEPGLFEKVKKGGKELLKAIGKGASAVKGKKGIMVKRAKSGTSLGMKSVKAGFDKNPGVTRADIIVAGKGKAQHGGKVMKKAQSGISQDKRTKLKIEDKAAGIEYQSKPVRKGASTTPIYIPRTSMKKGGKMGKCKYGCK